MTCDLYDNGNCIGLAMVEKGIYVAVEEQRRFFAQSMVSLKDMSITKDKINSFKNFYITRYCEHDASSCKFLELHEKTSE
ncbi:MAG: hypothetical protein KJ906_02200 [Nanoarchaeota archaeon]|nr:hypothetical protein [Nanoarchaeota archaeon]